MHIDRLIELLLAAAKMPSRDNSMAGNPRYQPEQLQPYLGYDSWALWLALVEVQWLLFLEELGYATDISNNLQEQQIVKLFQSLTTREQDKIERQPDIGHDINALIFMMKGELPPEVHNFIHANLTSYDAIETAQALMFKTTFDHCFWPLILKIDELWRQKIATFAETVQMGRTHLQHALPITVGMWLAQLHDRYRRTVKNAKNLSQDLSGKITGATGTSSALCAMGLPPNKTRDFPVLENKYRNLEDAFLRGKLGLKPNFNPFHNKPMLSTQITQPETLARFLHELVLLSGALANLGEDVRILQGSDIGEISSVGSTSSTMAHKTSNPITAENIAGMHTTVIAEYQKVLLNLVSDLQRDLRGSSPKRDYGAILVYVYQQLLNTKKLLEKLNINEERLKENFDRSGYLVMGELLYLALAKAGLNNAHTFVNKEVVPQAKAKHISLRRIMDLITIDENPEASAAWKKVDSDIKNLIANPSNYLGNAIALATEEAKHLLA